MYNWWQKISSPAGTLVNQFEEGELQRRKAA